MLPPCRCLAPIARCLALLAAILSVAPTRIAASVAQAASGGPLDAKIEIAQPLLLPVPSGVAADAGTWSEAAPLPVWRANLAAVAGTDGRIYAMGGDCVYNFCGPFADLRAYDPRTDTWESLPPMPTARTGLAAAVGGDGRIYAIGGIAAHFLSTVEAYDPGARTWATVAPLPTPRAGLAAATGPDGRIYAIGGINDYGAPAALTTVEVYDPRSNTWAPGPPLPSPRAGLAAVAGPDGRIYALGGNRDQTHAVATVDVLDVARGRWEAAPDLPSARADFAATAGLDGRIYVLGGRTERFALYPPADAAYTPATGTWEPLPRLPHPRPGLAAATGPDGRVYAIGGGAIGLQVTAVDVYRSPLPAASLPLHPCQFLLGFAALRAALPDMVGRCLDDEAHNPTNGDALQHTTNGLLVWRKADNVTAFTDGYRTWVNGPYGLRERLNTQRFPWEANPGGLPIVP